MTAESARPNARADASVALRRARSEYEAGRFDAAAAHAREAVAAAPDDPDPLQFLGLAQHARGATADGLDLIERALALRPHDATFHANRGALLQRLGRASEAEQAFSRAAALAPGDVEIWTNLAAIRNALGHREGALAAAGHGLALAPDTARAHVQRGLALAALGRRDDAIVAYRRAVALDPGQTGALAELDRLERGSETPAVDIDDLRRAVAAAPGDPDVRARLGAALLAAGAFAEAARELEAVVSHRPDRPDALSDLGWALAALGRLEEAEERLEAALALAPDNAACHANLGAALRLAGDSERAIAAYRRAVTLEPASAPLHRNLATMLIQADRLDEGWAEYEWRLECPELLPSLRPFAAAPWSIPRWRGQPLAGRKILVTGEQGVGDEIMLAGLVPDLVAAGAVVCLETHHRLAPIFARSLPGIVVIEARNPPDPRIAAFEPDFWSPAGSLPRRLRDRPEAFRPSPRYLRVDASRAADLRETYRDGGTPLVVGISWRGGSAANAHQRSLPLDAWLPILRTPDVRFVSLQYGDCRAELDALRTRHGIDVLEDASVDPLADMDAFAAQVAAMDLVVSTDNSTVHMAGALGVPVWALLHRVPDWRWFLDGEDSRWYRSARLFRQPAPGDWQGAVDRAAAALRERTADRSAAPAAPAAGTRRRPGPPRVALVNDTLNWYHWGCTGTSHALRETVEALGFEVRSLPITWTYALKRLPETIGAFDDPAVFAAFAEANPLVALELADADVIAINGEGTMHGLSPAVLGLLYLAYAAKRHLGKPVHLINHSAYPEAGPLADALYRKVYASLDRVAIREHRSLAVLAGLGVGATLAFDCLPLHITRHPPALRPSDRPYVALAGSAAIARADMAELTRFLGEVADTGFEIRLLTGARAFPSVDEQRFGETLARTSGLPPVAGFEAHSMDDWLACIGGASLLVSGRFHHSIAAATLGTPFVAMTSSTPKLEALMEMLEHAPAVPIDAPDLADRLIGAAEAELNAPPDTAGHGARVEALRSLALENFRGLAAIAPAAAA